MIANLIIAAIFAVIRIAGHKSDIFKDAAHLYVGGLFAWSVCEYYYAPYTRLDRQTEAAWLFGIAVVLSLIELTVAIIQGIQ